MSAPRHASDPTPNPRASGAGSRSGAGSGAGSGASHEARSLATWILLATGVALAAMAVAPQHALERVLENPARTAANGGAVLATTADGAALLRVLAPIAGAALVALVLAGGRVLRRADAPLSPSLPAAGRLDALVLAFALLLASVVRAPFLSESLWYDEIAAFLGYGMHGPGAALGNYSTQANHILQTALTSISASALGVSEFSLRLPALVAGLGAIPAVWWLGREARAPVAARAAAIAVALMPIAVLASTEARGYAFMLLFAALASAAFLRALRTRSATAWGMYALLAALGVWSHLVTVCVPLGHGVWCACVLVGWGGALGAGEDVRRRDAAAALAGLVVAALLAAAFLAPALPEMFAIRREFRALDGDEPSLQGVHGVDMLLMTGGSWTWWASLAALPAVVLGGAATWRSAPLRRAAVLGLLGVVVAVAAATALDSWLYARFLIFAVPSLALIAGAVACGTRALRWPAAVLAGAGWVACVATLPPRQPIREGVAYIVEHRAPADRAIAIGLPDDVHALYASAYGLELPGSGPYGRDTLQRTFEIRPRWILMLYPRALPAVLHEYLRQEGFRPVARLPGWIDRGGGEVVVLERPAEASNPPLPLAP